MVISRLAAYENTDGRPSWSPDGQRVAFELGTDTVVVNREDLEIEARLGPEDRWVATPDFSPDGETIVYSAFTQPPGEEYGSWGVFVSQADGSESEAVHWDGRKPEFNPQGDKIAFRFFKGRDNHVAVMDADGSNFTKVSGDGLLMLDLSWDPRGQQIVYDTWDEDGPQIRVTDTTGEKDRQLTDGEGGRYWDRNPEWSPDGTTILFERHSRGFPIAELWVVDPETGKDKMVAPLPGRNLDPAWSPDGSRIAFVSNADGGPDLDLYVMDGNGKNVQQVTDLGGDEHAPAWSPDGRSIAFHRIDFSQKGDDRYSYHIVDV